MPRFSIIVVHYQGSIPHDIFCRGITSLLAQTNRDFEILCYHDGPLLDPSIASPVPIICTPQRFNDSGHSLRDLGIRQATGDYIVHFNADNILYPEALEVISQEIDRPPRMYHGKTYVDSENLVVFPIKMFGMQRYFDRVARAPGQTGFFIILTGNPPYRGNIDAMQLVMKRSLWLQEGGWTDKSPESDSRLYAQFTAKYGYRAAGPVLGEHY